MKLNKFTDDQLLKSLEQTFAFERKTSQDILLHLKEIRTRRLYAERGFPNLFSMLVGYFKQSESAANQRLKALDLMLAVPIVEEHLMSGELTLSTVAMAQRQIRREEKLTGKNLSSEKKLEVVKAITGKTMAQAENELFKLLPETASHPESYERRVSSEATRVSLTLPDDVHQMMQRLKELWAHVDPTMDSIEVLRRAFKLTLEKIDPIQTKKRSDRHSAQPTEAKHRSTKRLTYYGKEFDHALWTRANSQCEYRDKKTGRRCACTFGLEREHIIPLGKGGTNKLSNMALFCRAHNLLQARRVFGNRKIDAHMARQF